MAAAKRDTPPPSPDGGRLPGPGGLTRSARRATTYVAFGAGAPTWGLEMRVAIAADHAGFSLKERLRSHLSARGHEVADLGAHDDAPSDYPDFAEAAGRAVIEGRAERAVLVCGSGVGVSAAANKIRGVRCAMCHDVYSAHQGVEHDDMNVLALGALVVGEALAADLVDAFLGARFDPAERHVRRLAKLRALEER